MPFSSTKQRNFMRAKHPDIAQRWSEKYGSEPRNKGKKRGLIGDMPKRYKK